jgi:predicted TIM-barrel fold metal-dependent hydrolase
VTLARLVAEFGAERIVWGSDFPQTHDRPYADLVALARDACANVQERDRDLVLGGTAVRLWPELTA